MGASRKGMIVLMGSGELTATMVEVHKEILARLGDAPRAAFLDTPAGFQLNADQLSQRAVDYFRCRVGHPLSVVSLKSSAISPYALEAALQGLKEADYILVGPGSPTYAVRQWQQTRVPAILRERVGAGGCLVAASAAALTVGRFTLPVYEIYKVGEALHWLDGIDVLSPFGFNHTVVPHWNNAEGGNHDTRFCFMGASRFESLSALLPPDVGIIGLDEHTACLIDFDREEAVVRGIGTVTLRHRAGEEVFRRGAPFPLAALRGGRPSAIVGNQTGHSPDDGLPSTETDAPFWEAVHGMEETFHATLDREPREATNAVLELDRIIWEAEQNLENPEFISQGREILRELIVLLGSALAAAPDSKEACLKPLMAELLALRARFREARQWAEADTLRDALQRAGIVIEDTDEGTRWRFM